MWSFRGNACDIPTDCPTRERSGWVGDWQIYVDTAAYLYDVTDFSAKWLRDLAADQLPGGAVTSIVPDPSPDAPIWNSGHGSAGWGDAAVHVPWELYRATGRTDFIADQLDSMRRWVDLRRRPRRPRAATPPASNAPPEPRPHERYLWDGGWHFGEWLVPGDDMDTIFRPCWRKTTASSPPRISRSSPTTAALAYARGDDPRRHRRRHRAARRPAQLGGLRTVRTQLDSGVTPSGIRGSSAMRGSVSRLG